MKSARKQYIREQKTICGDSYAEVDFCWITEREHRAGPRGKKQFASSLAQQKRNRERSARLLVQLLNTNFDQRGFAVTLTYEDMWLPDDDEAAWKDVYNYLKRVRRWLTRQNWQDATPHQVGVRDGKPRSRPGQRPERSAIPSPHGAAGGRPDRRPPRRPA